MDITTILTWVGNIASVFTLFGVIWAAATWFWQNRKVTIVAICDGEEKPIAALPARLITRAEVSGLAAQRAAGADRLDLSGFEFDYYKMVRRIEVPLNKHDFARLK